MNREAAARAIEDFLRALGHEPTGELANTGRQVAEAWCDDLLDGYGYDAAAILRDGSTANERPTDADSGLVAVRDLAVVTVCPHHLLPAHGRGDVIYLPGERLAGLGAIAKALRGLTRRLSLQEQTGEQMAQLLVEALGARGAACRLRLNHGCLIARGAREATAVVESLALAGSFTEPGPERDLALSVLTADGGT